MKTLREYIKEAEEKGVAIGHFNISNMEGLHGIYNASKKLSSEAGYLIPIIIGVSEGEEEFIGRDEVAVLVKMIRERDNYPIFLNADHHYTFESVKSVLDAGYDAAIIDAVKLPLEENMLLTKKCVKYAKELNEKRSRVLMDTTRMSPQDDFGKSSAESDILIEAEIGFIGQSSKLLDAIPDGISEATMTKPEDAKYFVDQTGIDLLAPSVGNIHGMVKGGNPRLDIERIKSIREACGVPLVLHGGSGIADEDFTNAIKAGIAVIHINTEIRVAYKKGIEESLKENPSEIAPYKFLKKSVEEVEKVVYNRLKLFNNL